MGWDGWHHDDKEWQETLDLAKSYGWPEPHKATDHGGLILQCPAGVHRIHVFSTGRSSENVARGFRKKIRNCQHSPVTQNVLGRIERSLGNAERWITAAETQLARADAEQRMAVIVETICEAEGMLAKAEDEFDLLDGQISRLEEALERLLPASPRPGPEELADRADGELRDAKLFFRQAPNGAPQLVALRMHHEALSTRLTLVRAHITA